MNEAVQEPAVRGVLVQRLFEQGIRDPRLLAAFARVGRERFLPEDRQRDADADRAIEIGFGQTISQPFVVAAMTGALQLQRDQRVLEIGTGSGYQTAILCELLAPGAVLHSIEIVPELSERAQHTLSSLGYTNFVLHVGDGRLGFPEAAPYDAILVAAAPEVVPPALVEQLAPGGRLVIPVGASPERQELQLWRRLPESSAIERTSLMQVRFVPLVR
jgi:protein-L-isoaspartate(D-aspartate) O-methyltransferase